MFFVFWITGKPNRQAQKSPLLEAGFLTSTWLDKCFSTSSSVGGRINATKK